MALGATATQSYLNLISQYESGNQNIPNYQYGPDTTAQGYYQITNTNWLAYAPQVGIDTSVYPSAMTASQAQQAQVAAYLLTQTPAGISNWSNYNSKLYAALVASGMQTAGTVTDGTGPFPVFDLSGSAANQPTSQILSQIEQSLPDLSQYGIDPGTELAILALGAAGVIALAVSAA